MTRRTNRITRPPPSGVRQLKPVSDPQEQGLTCTLPAAAPSYRVMWGLQAKRKHGRLYRAERSAICSSGDWGCGCNSWPILGAAAAPTGQGPAPFSWPWLVSSMAASHWAAVLAPPPLHGQVPCGLWRSLHIVLVGRLRLPARTVSPLRCPSERAAGHTSRLVLD